MTTEAQPQDLVGRTAIVTGAGRGLGRDIALALAERGGDVVVVGRTAGTLEDVCAQIRDRTGRCADLVVGDVKSPETASAAVERAHEMTGSIDILVNNAQEISVGPLLSLELSEFTSAWESGPMAALHFMRAAHKDLCGAGTVINLLSGAGVRWDMDTFGAYGAAKQALAAITRTAACEWGPLGIRVLGVMPNAATDAWHSFEKSYPDAAAELVSRIPLRRMGSTHDVGRMIALLCTPAASYMTGSVVKIDGGLVP